MTIWQTPATELARLIRAGSLSAREIVSAHLERIASVNERVNAIVTLTADRALEQARIADERFANHEPVGPLHGLPIAHKDLQETAGIRTTFGSPVFRDHVPDVDSPFVAHLKAAGAITVGKTNTPEFGAGSQTFNPVFGATLNPYDVTKTCGGSSGGAAAALACGMVPIADGTDMGGSLRNPAAFCGIVGMRPSPGLISTPDAAAWAALSVEGPMARTAADVALFFAAITSRRARGGDHPIEDELARDFAGTRIAWSVDFGGIPFDPRVRAVVDGQRGAFQSIGCGVANADADWSGADAIFKTLRARAFAAKYGAVVKANRELVKEAVVSEVERGESLTAAEIHETEQKRAALRERLAGFMEVYDFLVLPTTQVPPFDVEQPYVTEIDGTPMPSYIDWMKSCYYISTIGHPAASVPCGVTPEGLPVGIQIVGRAGADWAVLQLAHAYERARGAFPPPAL